MPPGPDFLANLAASLRQLLSRLRERCHTIIIDCPCIRPQTKLIESISTSDPVRSDPARISLRAILG